MKIDIGPTKIFNYDLQEIFDKYHIEDDDFNLISLNSIEDDAKKIIEFFDDSKDYIFDFARQSPISFDVKYNVDTYYAAYDIFESNNLIAPMILIRFKCEDCTNVITIPAKITRFKYCICGNMLFVKTIFNKKDIKYIFYRRNRE